MIDFAPYAPQTSQAPRLCDLINYGFDLGLHDYPIYDEADRDRLNQAIVDHFYIREIAYETPGMFIFALNRQLNEQMPQINQVWEMLHSGEDFLSNSAQTQTAETTGASTSSDTADNDAIADSRVYNTNAPQVSMVGKEEMDYYDTGTGSKNTSNSHAVSGSESATHTSTTGKASGRSGTVSDLIDSYYNGYNNTDLMVFDALEPCFSQIFGAVMPTF